MANHTRILSTQSTVEFEDIAEILQKLLSTNQSINQSVNSGWLESIKAWLIVGYLQFFCYSWAKEKKTFKI